MKRLVLSLVLFPSIDVITMLGSIIYVMESPFPLAVLIYIWKRVVTLKLYFSMLWDACVIFHHHSTMFLQLQCQNY